MNNTSKINSKMYIKIMEDYYGIKLTIFQKIKLKFHFWYWKITRSVFKRDLISIYYNVIKKGRK